MKTASAKNDKKIGVLFSGGLDSGAMVAMLLQRGYEIWPVYMQASLPWEKMELTRAKKFLRELHSPRLKVMTPVRLQLENAYRNNWSQQGKAPRFDSPDEDVFLPARNLLLITKAILFLSSKKIYRLAIATLKGNPFLDAKPSYFRLLEKILTKSFNHPVSVLTPCREFSKSELILANKTLPLHLTFSCINPHKKMHCGRCNKCAERRKAFVKARVLDKTIYARGCALP